MSSYPRNTDQSRGGFDIKKNLSVLLFLFLAVVLTVSVFHISAFAVQSDKPSSELKAKLDAMSDDDTVAVSITFGATGDEFAEHEEWDRLTDEITEREYGFTKAPPNKTVDQVNLWRRTRIGVMKERKKPSARDRSVSKARHRIQRGHRRFRSR